MTHSEQQYAALNAAARACNAKLKQVDKQDLQAIANVFDSFKSTVELLGFKLMDLKVQIGRLNGVLKDRRLD